MVGKMSPIPGTNKDAVGRECAPKQTQDKQLTIV